MSHVQNVFKKRAKKTGPVKTYNNPKSDGLYRVCHNCESMFKIDDPDTKAGLCWTCALKLMKSGHYLAQHITLPEWNYFPDAVAQKPKPVSAPKKKTTKGFGGGLCACGEEFERKTIRQKRCGTCIKESKRLAASARQRKYSGSA